MNHWTRWTTTLLLLTAACSQPPRTWVCNYAADADPALLAPYGLVVVDAAWPGQVGALKAQKALALAYISLGELHAQRPQFAAAKAAGLLVVENPNWPGAWLVDVRDPRWHRLIVEEMAPPLIARGFDGFFLDTVDSALHLEATQPERFGGMRAGAIQLIQALHARFPRARLLLNGALPLVGSLRAEVGMVAVESSLTDWDFSAKQGRWRTASERAWVKERLTAAQAANPELAVYTLDYWDPQDRDGLTRIYREQRAAGFVPYVATIGLDRVVPEPKAVAAPAPAPGLFAPPR